MIALSVWTLAALEPGVDGLASAVESFGEGALCEVTSSDDLADHPGRDSVEAHGCGSLCCVVMCDVTEDA